MGMLVDPRIITGAPAWLKPFKFAISTAIYSFTLAWLFAWLSDWPRVRRVVGWTTAVVFVLEVADHRRPGLARNNQSLQCVDAARWGAVRGDGGGDSAADARERRGRGGAVAAAIHRPDARVGTAVRHDVDHRRRPDRCPDDSPDGRAARRRAHHRTDDDDRRACRWRRGRRPRHAGDRVEPGARRPARSTLHRPSHDPGACVHRGRPAALAPARDRSSQGNVRCDGQLCVAVPAAALGGATGPQHGGTRCGDTCVDRHLGSRYRPRPWLDRPWFARHVARKLAGSAA